MTELTVQDIDDSVVNRVRLADWMDGAGLGSGPIQNLRPLGGGSQNIVAQFRRGSAQFVLRRPSAHPRANDDKTMMREARVLKALAGSDVPHPTLIAACEDRDVLGAAFYLMEPVDGFNAPVGLPDLHCGDARIRHRMGLALVESAVALAKIDHVAAGLGDFGKTDGFLERQTGRWRSQLESYGELAGWPGATAIGGVDEVGRWLDDNLPISSYQPGLIHGDYHIGNVLYCFDGPEIAAVIDWELATLGDPLLDMGWVLATGPDDEGVMSTPVIALEPRDGLPAPSELVAHYGRCSGRDMSPMPWFAVLACYKLGIILEGSYARACAGKAPKSIGDQFHSTTLRLFERAQRWMHASW